jgi:hypothetical protein
MSITRDWLSHTREGQLAMARNWLAVTAAAGTAWGIPGPALIELTNLMQRAGEIC